MSDALVPANSSSNFTNSSMHRNFYSQLNLPSPLEVHFLAHHFGSTSDHFQLIIFASRIITEDFRHFKIVSYGAEVLTGEDRCRGEQSQKILEKF